MRIRELVNHYIETPSWKIALEGATDIFFNPLTQGTTCYEFDSSQEV